MPPLKKFNSVWNMQTSSGWASSYFIGYMYAVWIMSKIVNLQNERFKLFYTKWIRNEDDF